MMLDRGSYDAHNWSYVHVAVHVVTVNCCLLCSDSDEDISPAVQSKKVYVAYTCSLSTEWWNL